MHGSRINTIILTHLIFSLILGYGFLLYQDLPGSSNNISLKYSNKGIRDPSILHKYWRPINDTLNNYLSISSSELSPNSSNIPICYDLINQVETSEFKDDIITPSATGNITPFQGVMEDNSHDLKSSHIFSPDDRQKINNTDEYPWRTTCKLYITADDGTHFIGSGAIIDEFHVLTCGHCAYLHDHGGWADKIEIVPGKTENLEPFGRCDVTHMRSTTGWTQDEIPEHDWAVLTLDRSIGLFTGWMGRKTADYSNSIYTEIVNSAGYPGDLDLGYNLYYTSENGDRADEFNHWYWLDTAGGQSGSPVFIAENGSNYIISIHAYGYESGSDANFGTRLNLNKFNQLNNWLAEDSLTPPADKPDLLDRGYYSNISDTSVVAGVSHFKITWDVKNEGTAVASSFKINYYLSQDQNITPSDYLISQNSIFDLDPFDFQSTNWEGAISNAIPEGEYYIGWIIDADDEIVEWDEDNNVVLLDNIMLKIKNQPFNPIPVFVSLFISTIISLFIIFEIRRIVRKIPDLRLKSYD